MDFREKKMSYIFLSRPRRFGQSILVDTLEAYFLGKKELFEGLKIMQLETEWVKRPVIRLDMSQAGAEPESLKDYLNYTFQEYESLYEIKVSNDSSLATRLSEIVRIAYEQTGEQVVILIDEYDSPLQRSWKTPLYEKCTAIYRDVFVILKSMDKFENFIFITACTKFSQFSLTSGLNNLSFIGFDSEYAALCGITKEEAIRYFKPEINKLAACKGWTFDEATIQLSSYYGGYHFSRRNMVDVFNPFSLINALADSDLKNYWLSSGTSPLLSKFEDDIKKRLKDFEYCPIISDTLESSDVTDGGAELFLYQLGYLTIKGYMDRIYLLGFPNSEVKKSLYETILPALTSEAEQ